MLNLFPVVFLYTLVYFQLLHNVSLWGSYIFRLSAVDIFFSPGATTPIGDCILQPSSGL